MIHLLRITSTKADESNVGPALENLKELYQSDSLIGDSVQGCCLLCSDGLAARLLTKKSPFYDMIMKEPTSEEEFSACPPDVCELILNYVVTNCLMRIKS